MKESMWGFHKLQLIILTRCWRLIRRGILSANLVRQSHSKLKIANLIRISTSHLPLIKPHQSKGAPCLPPSWIAVQTTKITTSKNSTKQRTPRTLTSTTAVWTPQHVTQPTNWARSWSVAKIYWKQILWAKVAARMVIDKAPKCSTRTATTLASATRQSCPRSSKVLPILGHLGQIGRPIRPSVCI